MKPYPHSAAIEVGSLKTRLRMDVCGVTETLGRAATALEELPGILAALETVSTDESLELASQARMAVHALQLAIVTCYQEGE